DVALAGRAEDRVDQRMDDHVAVRVTRETGLAGEVDACEHERHPVLEPMRIDPEPDAEIAHPSGSSRASRRSKSVTVSYPDPRACSIARSRSRPTFCGTWASDASVIGTPRVRAARSRAGFGYSFPCGL